MEKINFFDLYAGGIQATRESRPSIYYRTAGEEGWTYESCTEFIREENTLAAKFSSFILTMQEEEKNGIYILHAGIENITDTEYEIARVQYFDAPLGQAFSIIPPTDCRPLKKHIIRLGDIFPSQKERNLDWVKAGVYWERMEDPVSSTPNCVPCEDLASLIDEKTGDTVTIGFVGPGKSYGEVSFFANGDGRIMVGPQLDGIRMKAHEKRTLETMAAIPGDWQRARHTWAKLCTLYMEGGDLKKREKDFRLTGYCSWYQHYCMITGEQFEQAGVEFAPWAGNGKVLVQLDDGFQQKCGDWGANERFENCWKGLPQRLAEKNLIPGLWLAPFAVTEGSEPYIKLSHCIQRNKNGEPCVRFSNWNWALDDTRQYPQGTAYLDPALPEVKEYVANLIRSAVADGWKYLKLDFLYGISTNRVHSREKTTFEILRDLFAVMREAAGDDIWICSCTGKLSRFAMGYADSTRSGGDSGEEFASARANMWDYFLGLCTKEWWQCDPDVYFMRSERIQLSPIERRVMTATIGETGGCFQTSDIPSQWTEDDKDFVRRYWNGTAEDAKAESYLILRDWQIAAVAAERCGKPALLVYNWEDADMDVCLTKAELENAASPLRGIYSADGEKIADSDAVTVKNMPAHSVTVIRV